MGSTAGEAMEGPEQGSEELHLVFYTCPALCGGQCWLKGPAWEHEDRWGCLHLGDGGWRVFGCLMCFEDGTTGSC